MRVIIKPKDLHFELTPEFEPVYEEMTPQQKGVFHAVCISVETIYLLQEIKKSLDKLNSCNCNSNSN
ncbi:MAG: hypothetical protein WCE94_00650, partial [Candidatus Methanoperedens sp.]